MRVDVELVESTRGDAYVVKNLYPLYLHDLSAYTGEVPNGHGVLEESAGVRTLGDQGEGMGVWWERPGVLMPFLIRAGGRVAGFAMVARPPHVAKGVDYMMHEFFVAHGYRGTGVAGRAAVMAFERFRGVWHAYVLPGNERAVRFWERVIGGYTGGRFERGVGRTILCERELVIFSFDNRG